MDVRRGPAARAWRRGRALVAAGLVATLLLGAGAAARAEGPRASAGDALQAVREQLLPQLRTSAFGEPLVLRSVEGSDRVEGDVYADLDHAIGEVDAAFGSPAAVCELLLLHLNVHACEPSAAAAGDTLAIEVGPKRAGALGNSYRMDYRLDRQAVGTSYLRVTLQAAEGPLSTRDYRIVFEAVPLDGGRSFVHLGYAYRYGFVARLAMQAYLATAGRAKIGFTVTGRGADGQPVYVRGERAALERNVIRYYLALQAHCATNTRPPQERTEARLRTWFALTERYAPQLHEFELDDYLSEKHADLARAAAAKR